MTLQYQALTALNKGYNTSLVVVGSSMVPLVTVPLSGLKTRSDLVITGKIKGESNNTAFGLNWAILPDLGDPALTVEDPIESKIHTFPSGQDSRVAFGGAIVVFADDEQEHSLVLYASSAGGDFTIQAGDAYFEVWR